MAAVAGEAEAEAELRSGAPGAWAEQAPRSSQCQVEPLVAAPQPMLGTLSLDGQHNGHTWTPTQAWTLAAPSGTSTQECCLHTSPKSPKQDGPTHSTPESSTQEASLHAPTDTLVNQEPLYKHQGLPLTQEGSAAMKALPISPTRNSPLHSISQQEEQVNVFPATVDREVLTYQVMSPHTCMSTAPGQRHEADTTGQQGSPDSFPLTTTDERTLCKCSAQQQTFHLHHDTSPAKLEGNVTVCHQALEGLLCEAAVHQDPMIDCLGTRMQIDQSAGVLTSVVSHSDFADTSLLESEKNFAISPEPPAKEGSNQEITQAPLQAVENLHSVPPMALSQEESSNATLGTLALDRLTTPKGPLAHTFLDHTGLLTKAQILDDSSLCVVPSLVDSRSASDPSPLLDTFNRVPSLVDSLIEHMPLEGRATLTSLDCTLLPSLDCPESSPALCSSNVGVVSSLHSTMTLPVHGSETGSVTSISDPMAFSCLNNLDELPPVDCVVTISNDGACGKNVMLVDSRMPDSSPALNGSEKECFFSAVSSVHPSNPLAKTSSPVTSLTKVPFCPLNLPNADIPAVVCSEANTSSFLVEANSEGAIPVDADTKGPFPRDLKNPFVEHVDGKGPTPVDTESAGHFPGFAGGSFPVHIQTQPLFPLDSHDDGAHLLDVNNPNPSHNISLLDIHSEVESAISVDGEVEGQCAVNVQIEAPFHVNMVTHSSILTSSRASDALMSSMCSPLEGPLGKTLSNVAVIEASDPVASVEATAVFSSIDSTSGDDEVPVGKTLSDVAVNEASDPVASVEAKSVFASIRSTYGDDATVDWAEGTSGAPKLQGPSFAVKVERSSEVVRPERSTAACLAKEPLVIVQALSTLAGECFPSRLSFEVSPSLVPLPVGIPQVFSEFPLKIVPSQESSENDQVSLEAAPCQKPSEVAIIPSHFTSSQGSLIHSLVSSEAAPSRAPLEVALPPLESSSSSASEFTSVPSSSNIFEGELYSEDAPHQTQFLLEAPLPSPKSYFPQAPLAMEQTLVPLPITFSLEEVLLPRDTPMLCTNALVVQPSPSESPIHDDISLPTILELPVSAKVPSTMGGLGLQLSQDGLLVKTTLQNDQLLPQDGVTKHEEPLVKPPFHQVEPLLSRNISLPAVPFLQDGLLTGLNPGSEVRVTLDHIIEDALVVSFRLGERIFSGVLMDVSKRFGPHGIPVTVFPKRECKNTPSSIQPQVTSFHEEIMADCEPKVFSETFSSVVQNSEPSRIQSVWTSNPPPLFHEGAPYPPPLFIRDTYNQSIPQPPPRKIRRPKRKLYREEPTSIMNAIKLRPRQVLCDKCKTSVVTDKKDIKRGLSASEDSRKRRHDNLATVSKKLKTNHNVDGKGQTESQKRNVVAKVSNLAHGRSREVRVPTQSNSPKSQLHTKKVLQSKNIEQAKAREVLKLAKEKAQKKHMDTPGSKNTHPRGQVTRRFQNPSSGTLPPRLRLKPQRYRNEENDSSLKTRLEAVRSSKMIIKPQPRHITTRSSGDTLTEIESSTKDPDEANQVVQDLEVCALPGEQEDPQSLDKSPSKSNITVYVTLNQDQPGSSSASVCSSEGTDDLKSSHSECSSTENFDFPPGSMHTPPSSSSSSSLKEEKKANNELKIKVFSKNVSKCIGADGRTICAGDIVWAKIYGFPWWPARILNITVSRKDNGLLVRQEARISWFGSPTTSFVAVSQLAPFLDNFQLRFNKKRKGLYRKAITEAAKAAKQLTPEVRALLTQFET